jgi:hypothetical protein
LRCSVRIPLLPRIGHVIEEPQAEENGEPA